VKEFFENRFTFAKVSVKHQGAYLFWNKVYWCRIQKSNLHWQW